MAIAYFSHIAMLICHIVCHTPLYGLSHTPLTGLITAAATAAGLQHVLSTFEYTCIAARWR
jgi:hypothetical protein